MQFISTFFGLKNADGKHHPPANEKHIIEVLPLPLSWFDVCSIENPFDFSSSTLFQKAYENNGLSFVQKLGNDCSCLPEHLCVKIVVQTNVRPFLYV
jgi:hypothetical protein